MTNPIVSNFDLSGWPVVRYRMPDHVPDDQAEAQIAEFQAILARNERFAMIFWGPLKPAKSKHFMRLYGAWFKKNREAQSRLCAGAVRVEPDEQRRRSFALRAPRVRQQCLHALSVQGGWQRCGRHPAGAGMAVCKSKTQMNVDPE